MVRILLILSLFFFSCNGDDDINQGLCDQNVVINGDKYESTDINNYSIIDLMLIEDCLEITFAASGCDGESWDIDLIDSGNVAESFPVQRFMRVNLENTEACLAVIQKTISFDLTPIQTDEEIIRINLDGWPDQIEYEY